MIKNKVCPSCGSPDVVKIAGDLFMCQACGYSGSFKEKPLIGRMNSSFDMEDEMEIVKPVKMKTVKMKSVKKEVKKNVKRRR